ncbi:MAG: hypothetical protein JWP61_1339 [Friedmanniella sp.]|nr:hypothetical protein [Friedmanniella sp.]
MSKPPDRDLPGSPSPGHPSGPPEEHTDPGRPHPYESLYRGASQPARGFRPTPRHFEPSLSPPGGVDETFDWLYRPAGAADTGAPADGATVSGSSDAGAAGDAVPADPSVAPPTVVRPRPVPAEPPIAAQPAASSSLSPSGSRRAALVVGLAVLLVALIVVFLVLREQGGPGPGGAQAGPASRHGVRPLSAAPDCQAPAATDDAGQTVSYTPAGLLDGVASTAWRCDGAGVGHTIAFAFPAGSTVTQVGLVNGYAKVDPASGAHRYGEYRRITEVTWTFPDGAAYPQRLVDGEEGLQVMTVPAHPVGTVTLTIDASTPPGQPQSTRDAVLISDVAFATAGS